MKKTDFEKILQLEQIKEHDQEYRLKGFLIEFDESEYSAIFKGKIPLLLAEKIFEKAPEKTVFFAYSSVFDPYTWATSDEIEEFKAKRRLIEDPIRPENWDIEGKKKATPKEKLYVSMMECSKNEAFVIAIDAIREMGIINAWAIGND